MVPPRLPLLPLDLMVWDAMNYTTPIVTHRYRHSQSAIAHRAPMIGSFLTHGSLAHRRIPLADPVRGYAHIRVDDVTRARTPLSLLNPHSDDSIS